MNARKTIKDAAANDRALLIDGIKRIYNCHEANVSDDGDIWIMNPQSGHWLDDDGLARIAREIVEGNI